MADEEAQTFALSRSEVDRILARHVAVREGISGQLDATVEFRHDDVGAVEFVEISLRVLGPLPLPPRPIPDVLGDER